MCVAWVARVQQLADHIGWEAFHHLLSLSFVIFISRSTFRKVRKFRKEMNFALLLGAGAGLTWLSSDPTSVGEDTDDNAQTIRGIVSKITKNTRTKRRVSERPAHKDYPHTKHATRGEGDGDEEEIEGDGYVNSKREFKGIATDLVNQSFLAQKPDVFRFLRLVIDTHVAALKIYAESKDIKSDQLRFVYKGGNVLRIVASEFLIELPGHASDLVNDFYMPFFQRSDADFSIYIDPKLKNFEEVHQDLTQLTWLLQEHIRERMTANPHRYFEFFRLNTSTQTSILEGFIKALNGAESLKDPTNEMFYNSTAEGVRFEDVTAGLPPWGGSREVDTFISFADEKDHSEGTVTYIPRPDLTHYLRIQYNTALEFGKVDEMASFNLVRTKVIFSIRFKNELGVSSVMGLGGELIDVSLPKKADSGLSHFFDTPGAVDQYELKHNGKSLKFLGYSLAFLIDDLDLILFIRSEHPWDDRKYVKRLNRLFYMCFVETFVTFDGNTERKRYIKELCDRVVTKAFKTDLSQRTDRFITKWKDKGPPGFNRFAKRFADVAVAETDPNFTEYREFVDLVQRNCITVLTAFKNIGQFCTKGSALSEQRIYEGNFNALVRGE